MPTKPQPKTDAPGFFTRLRSRLEPPRLLSLTRAGKFFILMTIGVGFGAINTGNNLLFLLFGMMLSLILASGLLSEAVLRNMRLRRRLPRRIEAGQPAPGKFRLLNQGWWPSLSVEPSEQNPRGVLGPRAGQKVGPKRVSWWKFWRQQTDEELRPLAAAYCFRAPAQDETAVSTHYEFPARGVYDLPGLQLKTRFPFGLFEKTRRFSAPRSITVLPRSMPATEWIGRLDSRYGDTAKDRRGRGEEFFGLRDYRPGEDRRAIHWKSTARRGEPVVRETEARQRRALLLVFDNRAPVEKPTPSHRRTFEVGIEHLAGLIESLARTGYRIQLVTCEGRVIPENSGDSESLLRHLAVVDLHPLSAPKPIIDKIDDEFLQSRLRIGFDAVLPPETDTETRLTFDEFADSTSEVTS